MKLMLDTANLAKIEDYLNYLPVDGITTNPSVLRKEGNIDLVSHMKDIRNLVGDDVSLHVQVVAEDYEGIMRDARKILNTVGSNTYIKIPVSKNGLRAIKELKKENVLITATAIYSKVQALLAMELEADYLALYINRMSNLNTDPYEVVETVANQLRITNSKSKILGASYKNIDQIIQSVEKGASHVTVGSDVLDNFVIDPNIEKAVTDFANDWHAVHEKYEI